MAATYTGLTSPGCAASSGFLNLLTRYSAHRLSALFHAESVPGLSVLQGLPSRLDQRRPDGSVPLLFCARSRFNASTLPTLRLIEASRLLRFCARARFKQGLRLYAFLHPPSAPKRFGRGARRRFLAALPTLSPRTRSGVPISSCLRTYLSALPRALRSSNAARPPARMQNTLADNRPEPLTTSKAASSRRPLSRAETLRSPNSKG